MNRSTILEQLHRQAHSGQPIRLDIARADANNALHFSNNDDLGFVYHTSRFPNADQIAGLLPLADANGTVLELAKARLPQNKPIIAGLCGNDPFRLPEKLLAEIKSAGFIGVQNFPTCGMMDGNFRQHLEASNLGYAREVELILAARSLDLLTIPFVFNLENALQMLEAGADVLVLHPGAKACRKKFQLEEFVNDATTIGKKIKEIQKSVLLLRFHSREELTAI